MLSLFGSVDDEMPGLAGSITGIVRKELSRRQDDRPSSPPPSLWMYIKNAIAVATLAGISFSAGRASWRVDALAHELATHMAQNQIEHDSFSKRDVDAERFKSLQQQIETLTKLVERGQGRR